MSGLLLTSRIALAVVFGLAGMTKLLDRRGARQSFREFGVPPALIGPLTVLLPLAELAAASLLVAASTAWWGALLAAALLTAFTLAIVINLAQGRTPDCHCFGKLHSEAVGWGTVARNVLLASLAGFVVAQGAGNTGPGVMSWLGSLGRTDALLLLLGGAFLLFAAATVFTFLQLLKQAGRLMLRIEAIEAKLGGREALAAAPDAGLPIHSTAPEVPGLALAGGHAMLFFSEPGCSACEEMLPSVVRWQREHADRLKIVYVTRRHPHGIDVVELGLQNVFLQTNREVSEAYGVRATPSAVLVSHGKIASHVAAGADAIRALVFSQTLPPPVARGDAVPALELPDLDGNLTDVSAFKGQRSVLLFWNPGCGFCQAMLSDLRSWERVRPRRAPALIVVSAGSVDTNREQRFRSTVLLDQSFGAGRVFGVAGTPSAVAIDEHGRVASEIAVGAPAVLELIDARSLAGANV